MTSGARISACGRFRYALWRRWDPAGPVVCFIGLNPSTADARADDPTLRRCMRFAHDWRFGGLVMANLFAYRATNPAALRQAPDPVGPRNNHWLRRLSAQAALTVAAWGNGGRLGARDAEVLRLLGAVSCLGTTRTGAPRHPLYLPASTRPRLWSPTCR